MRIYFLITTLLIFSITDAKQDADLTAIGRGIEMVNNASGYEEYISAANYFEEFLDINDEYWLAWYYNSYSYVLASYSANNNRLKDDLADKAVFAADKALHLMPDEAEVLVLQAFVLQAKIQVNPVARGLSFSRRAEEWLKKAIDNDPSNPRAHLLTAYNIYYTPEIFGGGAANALPRFIDARNRFRSFKPDNEYAPSWGEKESVEMVELCRSQL